MEIKQELKKFVMEQTHRFYELGFSTSRDSGDLSTMDPETGLIYICPRPAKGYDIMPNWLCLKEEDVVVMDIEGNVVDGGPNGRFPTVEWPMHVAIYKARPDVKAVVHAHALYSGVFAAIGENIPACLVEALVNAGGDIECAKYGPVSSKLLGQNIVEALGEKKNAALMKQHGSVYVASNLEDALMVGEYVEKAAHTAIMAYSMGKTFPEMPTAIEELFDPSIFDILMEI